MRQRALSDGRRFVGSVAAGDARIVGTTRLRALPDGRGGFAVGDAALAVGRGGDAARVAVRANSIAAKISSAIRSYRHGLSATAIGYGVRSYRYGAVAICSGAFA
jgi:hypothetical protein